MAAHTGDATYAVILAENLDEGMPDPKKHFKVVSAVKPAKTEVEAADEHWLMVQALAFSADPYQRSKMKTGGGLEPNQPIQGFVAGKILAVGKGFQRTLMPSEWTEGDLFVAPLPLRTVQMVQGEEFIRKSFRKLTKALGGDEAKIGLGLNVLGLPGATAYAAMDILKPKEGQTFWVSDAGGAVGGLAVQLLKNVYNCRVIASGGGERKCQRIKTDLSPDFVFDHLGGGSEDWETKCKYLEGKLKEAAHNGIDGYLDFVGEAHFEAAFNCLKPKGRIALCGSMSHVNEPSNAKCMERISTARMIWMQQRIEGFLAFEWLDETRGKFSEEMEKHFRDGKVTHRETVYRGIDKWPQAFSSLFDKQNENVGKVIVYL